MDWNLFYKGLLIGVSVLLAALTSVGLLKWKDDNPVEELAEEIIKYETNFDIDLTPRSPE